MRKTRERNQPRLVGEIASARMELQAGDFVIEA
jgi:hypothetical protein